MSFRLKTILGIALIESIVLLLLVLGNLDFLTRSFDEELQKRAEASLRLFVASSKDAVIATDLATLDDALHELLQTPGVAYARVFGVNHILLSEGGDPEALKRPFVEDHELNSVDDGIYDVSSRITVGDYPFGHVEMGLDVNAIAGLIAEARRHNISFAVSEIVLVALFSFLLGSYLTRQLKSLTRASHAIARGNYDVQVPVHGRDELAETGSAFNRMAERIESTHTELQLAQTFLENSSEAITITDADNRIIAVNPAFTWITGYSEEEVMGRDPGFLSSGRHDEAFYREMWGTLERMGRWQGEIWNRRKSGEIYPEWLSIVTIRDTRGKVLQHMAVFSDITRRKQDEQKIWQQANFDVLTGLPNRTLFMDRLEQSMHLAHREGKQVALLFIDLDRFKRVNDSMGHAAGDELLQAVAQRLRRCVRETDTVARLGGDEFTAILTEIGQLTEIELVAEKILGRLSELFVIHGKEMMIGASIGITLYPRDGASVGDLLRNADTAMYRSKQAGRNTFRYYTQEMNDETERRLHLEHDVRLALAREELHVHYQPIVDSGGEVVGAEALLRWKHAELGDVPAEEFIPLAEENGAIIDMELWVIAEAVRLVKLWSERSGHDLFVSVNISGSHSRQQQSLDVVEHEIRRHGLKPGQLKLEITERMLMEHSAQVVEMFERLRTLGVQLSVDDFGTGYSSLSYLKRFPVDVLKIDYAFVEGLPDDEEDAALVEAIIVMGHSLGLHLVAEGVEKRSQHDFLVSLGCEMMQGFLFSAPLDEQAFNDYLLKHTGAERQPLTLVGDKH